MGYALCFMFGTMLGVVVQGQVFTVSEFLLCLFVALVTIVLITEEQ